MKNNFGKMMVVVAIIATFIPTVSSAAYLTVGSRGNDVVGLQSWLIKEGFPIPSIESGKATPGYFGQQTADAVKMYQESKGLSLTGSIDSNVIFGEEPKLGSVVGPDLYSPYFNVNGVRNWFYSAPAVNGASTTCSYKLPIGTFVIQSVSFSASALASSTQIEIGTDGTAYATTTSLGKLQSLPTTGGSLVLVSASSSASYNPVIVNTAASPKYLNYKLGYNGIIGSTPVTVGVCKAFLTQVDNLN